MFFTENPEASRRLAELLEGAMALSLLTYEQRYKAAQAAKTATSWEDLPKWLRDVLAQVDSAK